MSKDKKDKKFLKLPTYPGGKEAFRKFIAMNIRYPKEALEKRIEGTVYLKYSVSGQGKVISAEVLNGIGHGCDEEAIRLVKSLKFDKAKNRGVRVTSSMRTRINFKLPPQQQINYKITSGKDKKPEQREEKKPPITYSYTIKLGN